MSRRTTRSATRPSATESGVYTDSGTYTSAELIALADRIQPFLVKYNGYRQFWGPTLHDDDAASLQCRDENKPHILAFIVAVSIIHARLHWLPNPMHRQLPARSLSELEAIRSRLGPGSTRRTDEDQCDQCRRYSGPLSWMGCWATADGSCAVCSALKGAHKCSLARSEHDDVAVAVEEDSVDEEPVAESADLEFRRYCVDNIDGDSDYSDGDDEMTLVVDTRPSSESPSARTTPEPHPRTSRDSDDFEDDAEMGEANGAPADDNPNVEEARAPPNDDANRVEWLGEPEPEEMVNRPNEAASQTGPDAPRSLQAIVIRWPHIYLALEYALRLKDAAMVRRLITRAASLDAVINEFTEAPSSSPDDLKQRLDLVRGWGRIYYPLETIIGLNNYEADPTKRLLADAEMLNDVVWDIAATHGLAGMMADALL